MSIEKKYLKTRPVCKTTFILPEAAIGKGKKVYIAGDFNNWNTGATPLKRDRAGNFKATLELEKGRQYQFRYVIDQKTWENDWEADAYAPTPYGDVENSVVIV